MRKSSNKNPRKNLSGREMIIAMNRREARYDGIFYTAVTTTGIYCLPSCKARKPNPKNVVFFDSRKAARDSGYRACMRCKPDRFPASGPAWLEGCIQLLLERTDCRISDSELAGHARVDVSTLRRGFVEAYGQTPARYHREIRLQKAVRLLSKPHPILEICEECGYQSLSGFVDAFRKRFGVTPGRYDG